MADEHGCQLTLTHDGPGLILETDPRRVRQILLNLLSNAIKFGQGAPIDVLSRTLPEGGLEIAVRDHGRGIAPDDLPRVFDEFVQLDRGGATPEAATGTGLGLPISKRLAALLGGSLTAESTVGEGSVFRLVLPPAPPPRGAPVAGDGAPHTERGAGSSGAARTGAARSGGGRAAQRSAPPRPAPPAGPTGGPVEAGVVEAGAAPGAPP
jgi:anti-sigma regulatory factor (Ser/Thr protein kinase)